MIQLNAISVFGAKKNIYQYYLADNFHQNFGKNGKRSKTIALFSLGSKSLRPSSLIKSIDEVYCVA